MWYLEKGERVADFHFDASVKYIHHVAFAADGKRALVCADRRIYLIDASSGKVRRTLQGHTQAVVCAVFSPDDRLILSAGDDCTMRLWDASTGKLVRVLQGHESGVKRVAFHPDGRYALSGGSDATLRL